MNTPRVSQYGFEESSPSWPQDFEEEARRWRALFGENLVAIHHIGSTSVPGLPAKPIIDLLPVVRKISRVDLLSPDLERAGYRAWGEYGIPQRRFFSRDKGPFRTHNIHVFPEGSPHIDRHLAFCAFLREEDALRTDYGELKRRAYERHPDDIAAYNNGKNSWIKRVEKEAVEWYCSRRE